MARVERLAGELIECRSSALPVTLLFAAALGVAALAVVLHVPALFWATVILVEIALLVLLTRPAAVSFTLGPGAIEFKVPRPATVPYARIDAISTVVKKTRNGPSYRKLCLLYDGSWRIIPARVNAPLVELTEFLLARVGYTSTQPVHHVLDSYFREAAARFGTDKVFAFTGVPPRDAVPGRAILMSFVLLGTVTVALVSQGASSTKDAVGMSACTLVTFLIAGLLVVAFSKARSTPRHASGLVIGPAGIALAQKDVCGQMSWAELSDVQELTGRAKAFAIQGVATPQVLRLVVDGATIELFDVFDRPLVHIKRVIEMYWRGATTCPICGRQQRPVDGLACPDCIASAATSDAVPASSSGPN